MFKIINKEELSTGVMRIVVEAPEIVYRRAEKQMPARIEEAGNAREEGVKFQMLTQPVKAVADAKGFVKGLECIRMGAGKRQLRQ